METWREMLRDEENVPLARGVIRKVIGPLELWEGPTPAVVDFLKKYVEEPHWSQVPGAVPELGAAEPEVAFSAESQAGGSAGRPWYPVESQ